MIKVIDIATRTNTPTPEGHVRSVLGSSEEGTRVEPIAMEADDVMDESQLARRA